MMIAMEAWKSVVGFEGLYEVSNLGRVKRVPVQGRSTAGRVLKASPDSHGYPTVILCRDGTQTSRMSHQLVLEAFVGRRPEGMEARHLDGNPSNNKATNLAWGTRSENQRDRVRHGTDLRGERQPTAKITATQALEIYDLAWAGTITHSDIARAYGVSRQSVSAIKLGHTWSWETGAALVAPADRPKRVKLTKSEAKEIYALAWGGDLTQAEIADRYGIAQGHVSQIKLGKRRADAAEAKTP